MAHRLAKRRNLSLAFLPAANEQAAASYLNTGACDIYMRNLQITAGRALTFALTDPISQSAVGLVTQDHRRKELNSWDKLRAAGTDLRIGNVGAAETHMMIKSLLPAANIFDIAVDIKKEQLLLAEDGESILDGVAVYAEEGTAWVLLHPQFSMVVPQPAVFVPVAYAVAKDNHNLLRAVNAWLTTEKARGTMDALYNYWMLGGAIHSERPPRWSVIRDVLGWVD
jgi:ABC-type amino acid transport substrate-binding protein